MQKPLSVDTKLMAHTAEMLAMPQRVCRRGECHRKNGCKRYFPKTGEPCCLQNLTPEQRRLFDELYTLAASIRSWYILGFSSPDPVQRSLEDAGVEIVRAVIAPRDKRRFDAFRRDRDRIGRD